jgi:hypothetical protein
MAFAAGPDWSHLSGQSWLTTWTPEKVIAAPDPVIGLANYIEQILGVGFPTKKDLLILRVRINEIFAHYPNADYRTMCRIVQFNKRKKRKFARVYTVIDSFREAKMAGWLPELTRPTGDCKERIARILETETDPDWRARFLTCPDDDSRRFVLNEYEGRDAA